MTQYLLSRWYLALLAIVFGLGIASCGTTEAPAGDVSNGVFVTTASPYGTSYAQWTAKWWQWALQTKVHDGSTPAKVAHPLLDSTGAFAANGQDSTAQVFFLGGWYNGGGTFKRSVTVSASKALFFPLINFNTDTTGNEPAQIAAAAIDFLDSQKFVLSASVDGISIPNPSSYKFRSGAFSATLPADNLYQFSSLIYPAGTVISPIYSYGYWMMLAPLAAGTHTLHFTGECDSLGAKQDVTYTITAK